MTNKTVNLDFYGLKVRNNVTYTVKLNETDQIVFTYDESGNIVDSNHIGSLPLDVVLNAMTDIREGDVWRMGPYSLYTSEAAKYVHKHITFSPEVFSIDVVESRFQRDGQYEIVFSIEGIPGIMYHIRSKYEGISGIQITMGISRRLVETREEFLDPKTQERIIKAVKNHEKVRLKLLFRKA